MGCTGLYWAVLRHRDDGDDGVDGGNGGVVRMRRREVKILADGFTDASTRGLCGLDREKPFS